MNVIALQMDIAWEDKQANFEKVRRLLAEAQPSAGSLVLLPEMFATGFSMNTERCAEPYGGETEQFLAAIAQQYRVCLVGGVAMRGKDGKPRNKALIFSPEGRLLGFYAKMHPFTPGGEADHFIAGKAPTVVEWSGWKLSPFICYDLRFPELFRRAASQHKPELFVVLANWPTKRIGHWLKLLAARAIENQAFVVGVNRVGTDPFYSYNGRSVILDPQGEVLADGGETEGCVRADLELDGLRHYRKGLPFLDDLAGLL